VFAVDPSNANHLIVADAENPQTGQTGEMKVSNNGGGSWIVDQQLTQAVTMNGRLNFSPQVVYFDRADSNRILVGTAQAGLIVSTDGGQTWTTIVDSPNVPMITSVFSDWLNKFAYVGTFSRGLWRLNMIPPGYKEMLTYVGNIRGIQFSLLPVTLAATFLNNSRTPALPIANARISFRIRNFGSGCDALTDANGKAQCNATVNLPRGTYIVDARFAGDAQYAPTIVSTYFYVQ
jgi:hypothetical protein